MPSITLSLGKTSWLLPFSIVLVGAVVTIGQESPRDKLNQKATELVEAQTKEIRAELTQSRSDEWSGEYYYGDGLGVNVHVLIGPSGIFSYTWRGCVGLYDQNYGEARSAEGRLHLVPTLPDELDGSIRLETDYYQVQWGSRHYLIPVNQIVEFANAVNAGIEPRQNNFTSEFLLKQGDEKRRVTGIPNIPIEYADYLLSAPIQAKISSVVSKRSEKSWRTYTVVLNVGGAERVRPGMEFFLGGRAIATAKVTRVEEHTSEAEIKLMPSDTLRPSIDSKLATRLL